MERNLKNVSVYRNLIKTKTYKREPRGFELILTPQKSFNRKSLDLDGATESLSSNKSRQQFLLLLSCEKASLWMKP